MYCTDILLSKTVEQVLKRHSKTQSASHLLKFWFSEPMQDTTKTDLVSYLVLLTLPADPHDEFENYICLNHSVP